ncbi:DNA cytosine methyltransferase [Pseudomonas aeruginosa]
MKLTTTAYYNEIDPYAAQWLRNLIAAGHIAPGDVDERSIEDVHPDDLKHYTQCHFFAGIGVWSLALRRAGWPDDRPVWTGSCPCQPFSSAGQGAGFDDPRHLWPSWAWLIDKLRPATIFGEQVARAPDWVRLVRGDLVAMGYAVGGIPIEAACADSYSPRERFFLVADANGVGRKESRLQASRSSSKDQGRQTDIPRDAGQIGFVECLDGKRRPIEPGTFPLADEYPNRVEQLRAYGNAINAEAATQFIAAYMEAA